MPLTHALAPLLIAGAAAAAQPAGEFIVANVNSPAFDGNRIVRFELGPGAAEILDHFVAEGVSPLLFPQDMAFGPDGDLYVVSSVSLSGNQDSRVLRYDGRTGRPEGDFIGPGLAGLQTASTIVFTPSGDVLITNFIGDKVMRFDAGGAFIDDLVAPGAGGLDGAGDLVIDAAGDLYVASSFTHSVLKYDGSSGAFIEEAIPGGAGGLASPTGMAIDERGVLYVCSRDTNAVISRDLSQPPATAAVLVPPGTGGMDAPADVAATRRGTLIVACFQSGHVLEFDRDSGDLLDELVPPGSFGLGAPGPLAVVLVPDPPPVCYPDCDGSGALDIFDFLCFQDAFVAGCP